MRYLGLDVGERHIGVAVGEQLARELTTIHAGRDKSFYQQPELAWESLERLMRQEQTDAIVVGLPTTETGQVSAEAKKINDFAQALEKKFDQVVHLVNETLTSFMAQDLLESQGLTISQAKEREHQLAAQLILQQFLEGNAST